MDYTGIIKRAWSIVWRYRILWLFGLLAGGSGSGGGSSNFNMGSNDFGGGEYDFMYDAERWVETNMGLIVAVAAFLVLFALGMWIVSIAAKGGLIHLVREADEDRPVNGMAGWGVGFRYWGRIFLIDLLLVLPFVVLTLVFAALMILPFLGDFDNEAVTATAGLGVCGALVVGIPILLVIGLVVGVLEIYATRFAVLHDVPSMASIRQAWELLKSRFKDTALMYLIMFGIGIGFGIAALIVVATIGVAGFAGMVMAQGPAPIVIAAILIFMALIVPTGIYGAFVSGVWTLTFRELTEPAVAVATASAPSAGYMPPVPPQGGMPPMPPAPPAPPSVTMPQPPESHSAPEPQMPPTPEPESE